MKNMKKRLTAALLAATVCLGTALTSCGVLVPVDENTKTEQNKSPAPDAPAAIDYSVRVVDYFGTPITGVVVQLKGSDELMSVVNSDGYARFAVRSGEYNVTLDFTSEDTAALYEFDASGWKVNANSPELTVTLYNAPKGTETFYKDDVRYDAAKVGEGAYRVELTEGKMSYVVFRPAKAGIYEFGYVCDAAVELGAYGMPINVLDNSTLDFVNGVLRMSVMRSYVGETEASTTPTVIGIRCTDGNADACVLTVKHVGELPLEDDDVWRDMDASERYLTAFEVPANAELRDIPLNDSNLQVVLDSNGYYHLGTVDGPLVYIRITSGISYFREDGTGTLADAASLSLFGAKLYNADGQYTGQVRYNGMVASYAALCEEYNQADGVCPLTDELATMMKQVGGYRGWYNEGSATYLFGNVRGLIEENAWLFACCYYE